MSIKGYSTQKKLTQKLDGFTEAQTADTNQFITAQKTSSEQVGLDVISNALYRIHATVKAAEAGSTNPKRILKSTAHGGKPGDVVRFETTANNPGFQSGILSVPDANTIILAAELDDNIIPTSDTFYILRHVTPLVGSDGSIAISTAGLATEIKQNAQITTATNGTQKTQLVDSSFVNIDTLNSGAGLNALNFAMTATNYVLSALNSTTSQLNGGATFTGTIEGER